MWIVWLVIVAGSVPPLVWLARVRRRLVVVRVDGASMEPALAAGDRIVVRRLGAATPRVGQIVVVERPRYERDAWRWTSGAADGRTWMVKRVAAVTGDPVPAVVAAEVRAAPGAVVPPDRLVLLGDNDEVSSDSREFGYVPRDRVLGVALRRMRT